MKRQLQKLTVALAGNPNVGKSTLFNFMTGLRQHTGNWPGKTVDVATGRLCHSGYEITLVDLPGTYGLTGGSEDEEIAGHYISSASADCTVVVCDGCSLERSLILALQILNLTRRAVVCVNLMDEAGKRGIQLHKAQLEKALGAPVVLTSARDKKSHRMLLEAVCRTAIAPEQKREEFDDPIRQAGQIAGMCVTLSKTKEMDRQRRIDALLVSKGFGIPALLLLLFLILWITIWGANYPSELLGKLFDRGYDLLLSYTGWMPMWLQGFLIDGMYATAARVLSVMLPPMAIFFPLFTILEDVGYLPRMAFLLDGPMCKCGGCGKQALTLCMGLGCNAVGVTGCRIIDSPRERMNAILTNSMVPCNGRFPTLILLGSMFFGGLWASVGVAGCVVVGVFGAMAVSGVLSKTVCKHAQSVFLMEIPPFRRPRFGQILIRSLLDRTLHISLRALKVAAPTGGILWLLGNTPVFGKIVALLDPVGKIFGMSGAILLGFFFCLPANELFVPVALMAVTGAANLQSIQLVDANILYLAGWTWETAVCTMIFTLFHWPCATTIMTVYRETGSKKQTAAAILLPTAVGLICCFVLNILFALF